MRSIAQVVLLALIVPCTTSAPIAFAFEITDDMRHEQAERLGAIFFSALDARPIECPSDLDDGSDVLSLATCGKSPRLEGKGPGEAPALVDKILDPFVAPFAPWSSDGDDHRRAYKFDRFLVIVRLNTKKGTVRFVYPLQGLDCIEAGFGEGDGVVTNPVPIETVAAKYPRAAAFLRVPATVILQAVVYPDGSVGRACVMASSIEGRGFEQAAIDAIEQWTYEPGRVDGEPVEVRIQIEYKFTP